MTDEPQIAPAPAVAVAPAKDQPRAWHWSIWATITAPLLVMAILVWQLGKLEPSHWCGVAIGSAKLTDANQLSAIQSCFGLLTQLVGIYRTNTLALIVVIAICIVAIVVTTVKARVGIEAFGFKGDVGGEGGDH